MLTTEQKRKICLGLQKQMSSLATYGGWEGWIRFLKEGRTGWRYVSHCIRDAIVHHTNLDINDYQQALKLAEPLAMEFMKSIGLEDRL